MALINRHLMVNPSFTAVHCTHTAEADLDDFLAAGGNVCICPLTEANLGDGLANVARIWRHEGRVCAGTDSNARISFLEELRWLEYGQRLARQTRGVCRDERGRVGAGLWSVATVNGARALGIKTGLIKAGMEADLMVVDLGAPSLAGATAENLLETLILGAADHVVRGVCVGGRWLDPADPSRST